MQGFDASLNFANVFNRHGSQVLSSPHPFEHLASFLKDKELFLAIVELLKPDSIDDLMEFTHDDWTNLEVKVSDETLKLNVLDIKLLGTIREWYYQQDIDDGTM